ncbi:MAG: hypothetical protein LBU19_06330 [Treponema sp.]|jgi:hypothetical protein|nr:hypothetical protein [Treponema sp.]
MAAAVIVRPGGDVVLPPAPELIRNEAVPGDDVYAGHNTCKAVVDWGLSFLFESLV